MYQPRSFRHVSTAYWKTAAAQFKSPRIIAFAALIVALRGSLKFFEIPIAANLLITFDCYVSSLGSLVYGPLVALASGFFSDILGTILAPKGPFFFPFTAIEMLSSFLYALFFWKRKITPGRVMTAQFTVNLFCNIVGNSLCMKWMYALLDSGNTAYALINLSRVVKNLVMFPLETVLIVLVLQMAVPLVSSARLEFKVPPLPPLRRGRLLWQIGLLTVCSAGLIVLYIFVLKDYFTLHNFKLW